MSRSIFDIIKRQNGEAFAQTIRNYDSGIFDIPNLPKLVCYAGRNALPLLDYLESLKGVEVEVTGEAKDPFWLLEKAGYNAFYADTLEKQNSIIPYYQKNELLCTFSDPDRHKRYYIVHAIKKNANEIKRHEFMGREERDDAYGTSVISIQILKSGGFISIKNRYNHSVNSPDNTFYSNPDRIIDGLSFSLSKYFNVDFSLNQQVFLPDNYILVNDQILKYYAETNNVYFGDGFYVKDGSIHLIDKNSQLQIDTLILDLKTKDVFDPSFQNSPLKKIIQQEIADETLQVQNKNGVISLLGKDGVILTTVDKKLRSLTLKNVETLPIKAFYHHKSLEELNALSVTSCLCSAFEGCSSLKSVYLPKLEKSFPFSLFDETSCTVKAPLLEKMGICFFDSLAFDSKKQKFLTRGEYSKSLIELISSDCQQGKIRYEIKGNEFIFYNSLYQHSPCFKFREGKLVELTLLKTGDLEVENLINDLSYIEVLNLPYVKSLSCGNITNCPQLKKVYLPEVKVIAENCLFGCDRLQEVYAPALEIIGSYSCSYNQNLKKLEFPSLLEVKNGKCFSFSGYEEIVAPKLIRVGDGFCQNNLKLTKICMPSLNCISEYSFMFLEALKEIDLPKLQYVSDNVLISNNKNLKKASFKYMDKIPSLMLKDCPKLELIELKEFSSIQKKEMLIASRKTKKIPSDEKVRGS